MSRNYLVDADRYEAVFQMTRLSTDELAQVLDVMETMLEALLDEDHVPTREEFDAIIDAGILYAKRYFK